MKSVWIVSTGGMVKRVEVKTEMTSAMLYDRYRKAKDPVERTHWHMLRQVKAGKSPQEVGSTARLHRWMGSPDDPSLGS